MFTQAAFPDLPATIRANWAPVFLSPILHSPERFVIAIAVANGDGFHVEQANQLGRLSCLYGKAAETAIFAAQVALEELEGRLSESGLAALVPGSLVFSGVTLGDIAEGEARSMQEIGRIWLGALSSLYKLNVDRIEVDPENANGESLTDRLPAMVLDHVKSINPALASHFSEEIRAKRRRRLSSDVASISIDYNGPRLVANFATLAPSAPAHVVDRIKRKMFDLKVRQDKDGGLFEARDHEMILYSPGAEDPLVSEKQAERLGEVVEKLKEQSANEGFSFSAMQDVSRIGQRVLTAEGPVAGHA